MNTTEIVIFSTQKNWPEEPIIEINNFLPALKIVSMNANQIWPEQIKMKE
jgi:hypothetical protein